MFIQYIIAILIGIIAGTITGLTPGIHVNLISIIVLSLSPALLVYTTPLSLAIFITAMAITHTFLDFIPSILLGAPDEDTVLSILPGHRLLLKGHAYFGIIFTLYGSVAALFIIILITPLLILLLPLIYPYLQKIMGFILISLSILIIIREPNKKIWTIIIFLLAGFLGIASLNVNLKEPLLPLLTGLFGASGLCMSIKQNTSIPHQLIVPITKIKLSSTSIIRSSIAAIIASPFMAFLPGLGSSQAALLGKEIVNSKDQREYLFLIGAINTIVMGVSFIVLYSIQKSRTGAAATIAQLIPEFTFNNLLFLIGTIIIAGISSFFLTIFIAKYAVKSIHKINYSKLSMSIIFILLIIIFIFSDNTFQGKITALLVFMTSTTLGVFTIMSGVQRIHLMGSLLIPTILFYTI